MKIGTIEIEGKAVLAPMAGVTDMPFRQLCREQGASLSVTEMISAKALYYKNKNTVPLLAVSPKEEVVGLQLFGNEPELLAEEAAKLEDGPYSFFDINLGCPMPKIVNNREGSALMKEPELVEKIVSTMVKKLHKPVTIKIRKGFDEDHLNAKEIAQIAEAAGAAAVAIHGRTREEYYHGKADWDSIRQVKEAVHIPVLGSGDVFTAADAKQMLEETGVDAVMVARGARGNPWIFRDINALLETGCVPDRPSIPEVKEMITRHAQLLYTFVEKTDLERERGHGKKSLPSEIESRAHCEVSQRNARVARARDAHAPRTEIIAVRQMRAHVSWYSQGYPNATHLRRDINRADTFEQFFEILGQWK